MPASYWRNLYPGFLNDKVKFCVNREICRVFLFTIVPSFAQSGIRYQISTVLMCVHRENSNLWFFYPCVAS